MRVPGAAGALEEGWDEQSVLFMLSPQLLSLQILLFKEKKKTSMRTEIALDKVQPDWLRALSYPRAFLLSSQCGGSPAAF